MGHFGGSTYAVEVFGKPCICGIEAVVEKWRKVDRVNSNKNN
jgi:hypothetical protein